MGPTVRGKWNSVLYQICTVLCAMLSGTDVCVRRVSIVFRYKSLGVMLFCMYRIYFLAIVEVRDARLRSFLSLCRCLFDICF